MLAFTDLFSMNTFLTISCFDSVLIFTQEEKYTLATKQYKKIINYLDTESSLEGQEEEKRKSLLLAAHLNMSLCYLKVAEPIRAIQASDKALELDEKNVKGLFRRGQVKSN